MQAIIYSYLVWFLLPLWLMTGFADWFCHRKERIELTSGAKESLLHLLMLAEIGLPILYCLFFAINSTAILICFAGFISHEITTWWDVRYAFQCRRIGPTEQHVHGLLERLPLIGLSCIVFLNSEEFMALAGLTDRQPNFAIRLKTAWPFEWVAATLAAVFLLQVLPYCEELWRCVRASQSPRNVATAEGERH